MSRPLHEAAPNAGVWNLRQSLLQEEGMWQVFLGLPWEPRLLAYSPHWGRQRSGLLPVTCSELWIGLCGYGADLLVHGAWPVQLTLGWQHGCL